MIASTENLSFYHAQSFDLFDLLFCTVFDVQWNFHDDFLEGSVQFCYRESELVLEIFCERIFDKILIISRKSSSVPSRDHTKNGKVPMLTCS